MGENQWWFAEPFCSDTGEIHHNDIIIDLVFEFMWYFLPWEITTSISPFEKYKYPPNKLPWNLKMMISNIGHVSAPM